MNICIQRGMILWPLFKLKILHVPGFCTRVWSVQLCLALRNSIGASIVVANDIQHGSQRIHVSVGLQKFLTVAHIHWLQLFPSQMSVSKQSTIYL